MEVSGKRGETLRTSTMAVSGRTGDIPEEGACSVEDITQYCDPCFEVGHHVKASGYCTNCNDFLCQDCYASHSRVKFTRDHSLQDKESMPRGKHDIADVSHKHDRLTDSCSVHANKTIEYHCTTHNKLCCITCVTVDHKNCAGIEYIPDISKGISDSQRCKDITSTSDELIATSHDIEQKMVETRKTVMEDSKDYTIAARAYRDELVYRIDKLLADAEDKRKSHVDKVLAQLDGAHKSIKEQRLSLMAAKTTIAARKQDNRDNSLYVSIVTAETLINKVKKIAADVRTASHVKSFEFHRNLSLSDMIERMPTLGDVVEFADMRVDRDDSYTLISAACSLADGRLIAADYYNKSITLFALDTTPTVCYDLDSPPRGMAEVGDGKVVITFHENKTIQYFTITDTITPGQIIQTEHPYSDVTLCRDKLAVIDHIDDSIRILNMNGMIIKTLTFSQDSCGINSTSRIRFHPGNKRLYFTTRDSVRCTKMDGHLVSEYRNDKLSEASGLAIHPAGSVYVCGSGSCSIHHITADCEPIEKIPVDSDPYTICINRMGTRLYCTDIFHGYISVIKIRPTMSTAND